MACEDCLDPVVIETKNSSAPTDSSTPFDLGDLDDNTMRIIETPTAQTHVWAYRDSGNVYVQLFSINESPNGWFADWGTKYSLGAYSTNANEQPIQVIVVDDTRFAVWFFKDYTTNYFPVVHVCTWSGTTVSTSSENEVINAFEQGVLTSFASTQEQGGIWCDRDGTDPSLFVLTPYEPFDGTCAPDSIQLCWLKGSCGGSGNTITWDTTTCNDGSSHDIGDWQVLDANIHTDENMKFAEGGGYGVGLWYRASNLRMRALDPSGPTWGSEIQLNNSNIAPTTTGVFRLTSTTYIAWAIAGLYNLYAWAITRSGTALTGGTRTLIVNTAEFIKHAHFARMSNTEWAFITNGTTSTPTCSCDSIYKCSVSGTTITVDDSNTTFLATDSKMTVPDLGWDTYIYQMCGRQFPDYNIDVGRAVDISLSDVAYMQPGGMWSRP